MLIALGGAFVFLLFYIYRNRRLVRGLRQTKESLDRVTGILETDLNGYIIKCNSLFCESLGYTEKELLGKHSRMFKSGFHDEEFYEKLWKALKAGEIWYGELCNRKKDGNFVWQEGSILPVKNSKGQIIKYLSLRQNVTTRKELEAQLQNSKKQLEENLDWRRNILESANYSIIATDKDGTILAFNHYAQKMLGYDPSEVIGRTTPIIFHKIEELVIRSRKSQNSIDIKTDRDPLQNISFKSLVENAEMSPDSIDVEMSYVKKNGTSFPVRLSISCLRDLKNNITGFLFIGADITREKLFKNELIQAKETALKASNVKSDFLANMSHEIRTPLNGIIGMTDILMESGLNLDQSKCAETVMTSAQNLLAIINDILDFSKIESGKMEMEHIPFNLKTILSEYLQAIKFAAERKELYFKYTLTELPFEIHGDPGRLGQVLYNLLGNAIKFTNSGGVSFSSELIEDRDDEVTMKFVVKDTGIGISEEAKVRLFQSFSQADTSTARKYGGSGLGLTIAKRLVTLMGGNIQFESIEEIGTTFWFTLNFKKGRPLEKTEDSVKKQIVLTALDARILVAEDVTTNQILFSRMLKKFGCKFQVVSNGKEALEALEDGEYDLVIMDCQMPEMDGYEATRIIRKHLNQKISQTPILALTANALKGDREKCIEAGMDDYLSKPVTQVKLHEAISKFIIAK